MFPHSLQALSSFWFRSRTSRAFSLQPVRRYSGSLCGIAVLGSLNLALAEEIPEIIVVGVSPVTAAGLPSDRLPYAIYSIHAETLRRAGSLDLTEYLNHHLSSVTINSAQNNPLQPDLQFRGFTASPLLGLPQGLAVYQGGARVNEPLGDTVNWDLIPQSAIHRLTVVSGANPVYGLNTLGGALALDMKNGFNYQGVEATASSGSWRRRRGTFQAGDHHGMWGYYANFEWFDEHGWRDLSDSRARNLYANVSWRDEDRSAIDLSYQYGNTDLTGNGALPVGLMALDRSAIFTAPDITKNKLHMTTLEASHYFTDQLQWAGTAYYRRNRTKSFNGDASDLEQCLFAGGGRAMLSEDDALEDRLEDDLGLDLDELCEGGDPALSSFADLQARIDNQARSQGLDPAEYQLHDVSSDLAGSGIWSDAAVNNLSERKQVSRGLDMQLSALSPLFDRDNHLVLGAAYFDGESDFASTMELAGLDPGTRSTEGLGTGTFLATQAVTMKTRSRTWSLYFSNTHNLTPRLAVTLAGRYNQSTIRLRDRSSQRPELNGKHRYQRFNPSLGASYAATDALTTYAYYSEASRTPSPIELACNEQSFTVARQYAAARGEDPERVDLECRLPNAFLADPPLRQVVTKNIELGLRGRWQQLEFQLGLFRSRNRDDILWQTTGRATGLFANVDETRRQGAELTVQQRWQRAEWFAAYSYIDATFEDRFKALSPVHPHANAEGEISVHPGDRIPGIPRHQLKFGASYDFTPGPRIGIELIRHSDQVLRGDESNQLRTVSGYHLVNLTANWQVLEQLEIFARLNNVLDKKYENFGLLGEDPSEVIPGLADTRPRFLGVGPPRAGWLGLRWRLH